MVSKEQLIAFRDRVAAAFEAKQIKAPVHLNSDEQAEPLIEIFREIQPWDWVFSNWRGQWHALLKGIPEEELFQKILDGKSMSIMSAEHRFISSSIVGGVLPIAVGLAMGARYHGDAEKCYVFCGDMTARTGLFYECVQYVKGHSLPVEFIIEDNSMSTDTPTDLTWGLGSSVSIRTYRYTRNTPHVGTGRRVQF